MGTVDLLFFRGFYIVTDISFLGQEINSCDWDPILVTGNLFLKKEIILATGNLLLYSEICSWCRNFISVREKLLWQNLYSNDLKSITLTLIIFLLQTFNSCARNCSHAIEIYFLWGETFFCKFCSRHIFVGVPVRS